MIDQILKIKTHIMKSPSISMLSIKSKILRALKRRKINVYIITFVVLSFNINQNIFVKHRPLILNHSYLFKLIIVIDFQFKTFMSNI